MLGFVNRLGTFVTFAAIIASHAFAAAPPIILAKVLDPSVDPAHYLVSEKFDGVRAVWDGKVLRFRSGNVVNAPQWFIEKLPKTPLDGELWLARGKFYCRIWAWLFGTHVITFTHFDAIVAKDRVGSRDVEEKMRQRITQQVRLAGEFSFFRGAWT